MLTVSRKSAITSVLAPLPAIMLAACGAMGGGGAERQSPDARSATPESAPPEPTGCRHGELIPAVDIPAVHADPVVIPEVRIGGEVVPEVTIPGVDLPAQRIPAQCTEIRPSSGRRWSGRA